jgi:aminoglycoside phosphotransferase family enzyme/predicted kinase
MGIVRSSDPASQPDLIQALLEPRAYPTAQGVEHIETHISHVFLTGAFAYKIKKPVDLGFLDFSTLEKRRALCEEELRINRRLAPDLYLAVVPIAQTPEGPRVEAQGIAIEFAVKMRRFPQDGLVDGALERGELTPDRIDELARTLARFHADLPPASGDGRYGSVASIVGPARQNFEQLGPLLEETDRERLAHLQTWTDRRSAELAERFEQRRRDGFVRECHGDLHLANMVLLDGAVRIFDAIEFNPALRWIDVMNEIAFVVMDLAVRGRGDLGSRLLNAYLEHTGDYPGVRVLRYYVVYRAIVRAKIAMMRAAQGDIGDAERRALAEKCRRHLALAANVADAGRPALVIHHGLSGSGKTSCSQIILESIGAVRIRSDIERKRMHGLAASARTGSAPDAGIYAPASTGQTYARLAELAEAVIDGGYVALVDATFLLRAQRDAFRSLALRLGVPFRIAHFTAPHATLVARVAHRAAQAADASEAGPKVLEAQLTRLEPLGTDEAVAAVRFETDRIDPSEVIARAQRLRAS